MQVVATRAQPTLQFDVSAPDGTPRRSTIFTGTVDVAPFDSGQRFRVLVSDPNGAPLGFYVGDPFALPLSGSLLVAEAWVARMPISTGASQNLRYGITDVTASLVPVDTQPDVGWPYLQALLFGADLTMTIAYRLTVLSPR